jgi:soluble cytochrome b562
MNNYKKLEWIHFAIQEAMNGNVEELNQAIKFVEDLRENYLTPAEK